MFVAQRLSTATNFRLSIVLLLIFPNDPKIALAHLIVPVHYGMIYRQLRDIAFSIAMGHKEDAESVAHHQGVWGGMIPYNNMYCARNIKIRINGLKSYTYFLEMKLACRNFYTKLNMKKTLL
jgi:hypothetical protein